MDIFGIKPSSANINSTVLIHVEHWKIICKIFPFLAPFELWWSVGEEWNLNKDLPN